MSSKKRKDPDISTHEQEWFNNYFHNDYKYGPKKKGMGIRSWSKKKADDVLKYCTKCNLVWEKAIFTSKIVFYENFPTYGKERKECPQCKNQKA